MRTTALFVLALAACGGGASSEPEPSAPSPDAVAAEALAGRLCALYERVGVTCEWSGNSAVVGDTTVVVEASVAEEAHAGSAWTLVLTYDFKVDDKEVSALRGRGVGGGASRSAAVEMAADDWARVFGTAFVDQQRHTGRLAVLQSLQDDQTPPPAFAYGEWVAYPGYTDLRGKRTEKKMIDIAEVLATAEPSTTSWGEGVHGMYVHFERRGTAMIDAQCWLDGRDSPELCERMKSYDWPDGEYLLKQYIAFREGPLPEGVKARGAAEAEGEPDAAEE